MGPFEMLAELHREWGRHLEALTEARSEAQLRARAGPFLEGVRLHVRVGAAHVWPLLARIAGPAGAAEEAVALLTARELLEELEALPVGSADWLARLTALGDVVAAHLRLRQARFLPRLEAALDARQREALLRALAATRETLRRRPGGG